MAGENKLQEYAFEQMNLQVGGRIQLITHRTLRPMQHFSTVIGWVRDEYMIVKIPMENNGPIAVTEGDKLTVELSRLSELADSMPPGFAPVAESGVNTVDDVNSIVGLGYRVALIGTTLMNSPEPRELLGKLLSTGRQTAMGMATRKLRIAKGDMHEE